MYKEVRLCLRVCGFYLYTIQQQHGGILCVSLSKDSEKVNRLAQWSLFGVSGEMSFCAYDAKTKNSQLEKAQDDLLVKGPLQSRCKCNFKMNLVTVPMLNKTTAASVVRNGHFSGLEKCACA